MDPLAPAFTANVDQRTAQAAAIAIVALVRRTSDPELAESLTDLAEQLAHHRDSARPDSDVPLDRC